MTLTPEDLQKIKGMIDAAVDKAIKSQEHTGTDSKKINGKNLLKSPQDALTLANGGVVNTGDGVSDGVITNIRTRLGEIQTALENLGLIRN